MKKKEFCGQCHVTVRSHWCAKWRRHTYQKPPLERWPVASSSLRVIILYLFVCSSPPPPCPTSWALFLINYRHASITSSRIPLLLTRITCNFYSTFLSLSWSKKPQLVFILGCKLWPRKVYYIELNHSPSSTIYLHVALCSRLLYCKVIVEQILVGLEISHRTLRLCFNFQIKIECQRDLNWSQRTFLLQAYTLYLGIPGDVKMAIIYYLFNIYIAKTTEEPFSSRIGSLTFAGHGC